MSNAQPEREERDYRTRTRSIDYGEDHLTCNAHRVVSVYAAWDVTVPAMWRRLLASGSVYEDDGERKK